MIDIKKINSLDKSEFLSIFGNVFEKSKWISEKVFDKKPFKNLESFVSEIIGIYENSDNKTVLEILNLHPELAVEKKLIVLINLNFYQFLEMYLKNQNG